ncbi:MAG: hypothetical protein Q8R74_10665 [Methylophilus sp.]|nr:hypothetical protein [Methylophilus sp.]
MKQKLNLVSIQLRLLMVTVLFVMAGISLASQYSDTSLVADDTAQVRVVEMQEANGGSEPPLDNQTVTKVFVLGLLLAFASAYVFKYVQPENVVSNRRFLHLVRSRSPPKL